MLNPNIRSQSPALWFFHTKWYFLFFLSFFSLQAYSQIPGWLWAKGIGGPSDDASLAIDTDVFGNVYTTGNFDGTVDFDPGPGVYNLTGNSDIFISKLDASGNFLWAIKISGAQLDKGISISVDPAGNGVYTTGIFQGVVDFDPGPGVFNLSSVSGGPDIFVSKLDLAGNFIWAKQIGGSGADFGQGISADPSGTGSSYITGVFQGTVDFNPGAGVFNLTSAGALDIFIIKLDALGNFVWVKGLGGIGSDYALTLAMDPAGSGDVYISGYFFDTVDFDPGPATFNLTAVNSSDLYILKLNSTGNFAWAKRIGGIDPAYCYSIAIDSWSNVYTTGSFYGTVDFNPDAGIFNLTAAGQSDIFISKLNSSGAFIWAKAIGGGVSSLDDQGLGITVDPGGNVYTTGYFNGTADFDPGAGVFNLTASNSTDIFISKLDAAGNFSWAKSAGGSYYDKGYAIACDPGGHLLLTGNFQSSSITFSPTTLTNSPGYYYDIFIVKVDNSCSSPASPAIPSGSSIVCRNTTGNTYSVPAVNGATSYSWTFPSGTTISSGQGTNSVSINFGASAMSGNICVYASNSCGNSPPACKAISVVTAVPGTPSSITGTTLPCASSSGVPYSCPVVTNASSYNWTVPSTATIASGQGTNSITVNFASNFTSGSIKVQSVNCYGSSSFRSLTVRGKPSTPGVIAGPATGVCAGTNGVTYSIPAVTGASTYTWTAPVNATIATGQGTNSVTVNFSASFTSGTLSATAGNTCGNSAARTLNIYSVPTTPGTITGSSIGVCAGTNGVAYSIAAASGATSYTWTAPLNANIGTGQGTTSVTVNYSASFTTGTLSVKALNSCGLSGNRTLSIKSVPTTPGTMTGPTTVCANQTGVTYSIVAISGATTYNWVVPTGATVATGQGTTSVTVNFGTSAGSVKVQSGNACGYSTFRTKTVSITCRETPESFSPTENELLVYPNPASQKTTVVFSQTGSSLVLLTLTDLTGRIISQKSMEVAAGMYAIELDLSSVSKGAYTVSLVSEGRRLYGKLVVE